MTYHLCIARDGWARIDGFAFPRWAICLSRDGVTPAYHWKNNGPRALCRTSAMKAAPEWMHRAVAFVQAEGGLPFDYCDAVVQWFKAHRTGVPTWDELGAVAAK